MKVLPVCSRRRMRSGRYPGCKQCRSENNRSLSKQTHYQQLHTVWLRHINSTTNESAGMACSNVRLWKMDTSKEWRLWDERTEKDSAGSTDRKKTKEWVLNKARVKRELLDTVKARKLAYYGDTIKNKAVAWSKRWCKEPVAARGQGAPGQMTWLKGFRPGCRPGFRTGCFFFFQKK